MQKVSTSTLRRASLLLVLAAILLGGLRAWGQRDASNHRVPNTDPIELATRSVLTAITSAGERIVAVGERGIVLLSDDYGKSWKLAQVPVLNTLTAVRFRDEHVGLAVGHQNVILRTVDGGSTWTTVVEAASGPVPPLLAVEWSNPETAIALGGFGEALISQDAGASWVPMKDEIPNESEYHLYGIARSNDTTLLSGELGTLISWDATGETTLLESPYDGSFFGALGTHHGFFIFGLRGSAFTSYDGGKSWLRCNVPTEAAITAATTRGNKLLISTMSGEVLTSPVDRCDFTPTSVRYPGPATDLLATSKGGIAVVGANGVLMASNGQ